MGVLPAIGGVIVQIMSMGDMVDEGENWDTLNFWQIYGISCCKKTEIKLYVETRMSKNNEIGELQYLQYPHFTFLNSVDQHCSEADVRLGLRLWHRADGLTPLFSASIWYGQSSRPGTLLLPSLSVFFTSTFNLACVILDYPYLNCVFYLYVWVKCTVLWKSLHVLVLTVQRSKFLLLAPFFTCFKRHDETFIHSVHFWCFDEQEP